MFAMFEYVKNCWLPGIFTHGHFSTEWRIKQKTLRESQFCGRQHLIDERGQRKMVRQFWVDRMSLVTHWWAQKHLRTHNTLKRMDYNSRRPFRLQPRTENWGFGRRGLTQTRQLKNINWWSSTCLTTSVPVSSRTLTRVSPDSFRISAGRL